MKSVIVASILLMAVAAARPLGARQADSFDHAYAGYAAVLRDHVTGGRVAYSKLLRNRASLERVVAEFGQAAAAPESTWTRAQRLAFWINAYNAFTLKAIVDHYPIQGTWFSLYPVSSIRQISGVWDGLQWSAAGRRVTLDGIEHGILRPTFKEPRIHLAVNCASVSCPPLRAEPYRAEVLDSQLDDAAQKFLASDQGLRIDGPTLRVSSLFKWYGEDFVSQYAGTAAGGRPDTDRAILGLIRRYGPPAAAALTQTADVRIAYLSYDWSLNDLDSR